MARIVELEVDGDHVGGRVEMAGPQQQTGHKGVSRAASRRWLNTPADIHRATPMKGTRGRGRVR
jgi:hypothetical protein